MCYYYIKYIQLYVICNGIIVKIVKVCAQNRVLTCQPTTMSAPTVVAATTTAATNRLDWQINIHVIALTVSCANKYGIYTHTAGTHSVIHSVFHLVSDSVGLSISDSVIGVWKLSLISGH